VAAGRRPGSGHAVNSAARAIGDHLAAGSAAVSAAGAKIARLARNAGHARLGSATGRETNYAPAADIGSMPRGSADWRDLVGRVPQPRVAPG
jgi:hypothetical protein